MVELRDEIIKESKKWNGACCPLKMYEDGKDGNLSHYNLSQLFGGLGSWKWTCPFCGKRFEE